METCACGHTDRHHYKRGKCDIAGCGCRGLRVVEETDHVPPVTAALRAPDGTLTVLDARPGQLPEPKRLDDVVEQAVAASVPVDVDTRLREIREQTSGLRKQLAALIEEQVELRDRHGLRHLGRPRKR